MFQIFDKDKLFGKKRQERQEMKKNIKNAVRQEVAQNKAAAQTKDFYETSAAYLRDHNKIDQELYARNNVKRGLRNSNGTGVVVGLTRIGEVKGYEVDENRNKIPAEGKLYYRGYSVEVLLKDVSVSRRSRSFLYSVSSLQNLNLQNSTELSDQSVNFLTDSRVI